MYTLAAFHRADKHLDACNPVKLRHTLAVEDAALAQLDFDNFNTPLCKGIAAQKRRKLKQPENLPRGRPFRIDRHTQPQFVL